MRVTYQSPRRPASQGGGESRPAHATPYPRHVPVPVLSCRVRRRAARRWRLSSSLATWLCEPRPFRLRVAGTGDAETVPPSATEPDEGGSWETPAGGAAPGVGSTAPSATCWRTCSSRKEVSYELGRGRSERPRSETDRCFSGSCAALGPPAATLLRPYAFYFNQKGVTPAIANPPRRRGWRLPAPLPRPLLSVCLFGVHTPHKPMISQSHHHHHYQLTRNHYNPHSGFDAVSAPQSTAKEPDHPNIYHCSRLSSYGLFWVTIYIAPAIHTLTLLSSDFLPYSTDVWSPLRHLVPLYLTNSWSLRTIRTLRSRCFFFHFSVSFCAFSLVLVPFVFFLSAISFRIFPVRDFISHFSCPRFHFEFLHRPRPRACALSHQKT